MGWFGAAIKDDSQIGDLFLQAFVELKNPLQSDTREGASRKKNSVTSPGESIPAIAL